MGNDLCLSFSLSLSSSVLFLPNLPLLPWSAISFDLLFISLIIYINSSCRIFEEKKNQTNDNTTHVISSHLASLSNKQKIQLFICHLSCPIYYIHSSSSRENIYF